MAPHVSEESMVLKVLERLRVLRGPLLVECGQSFFFQEIAKMRRRPEVDTLRFTSRGHGDFVFACGSCRFARCTVLVPFRQSEMPR